MIKGFRHGKIFTEFTLMCIATLGAFAIGEYADAAALMFLYSLGESVSHGAYERSERSISELMKIAPEHARVLREGAAVEVSPSEVQVGEVLIINAGERVPLDCVVLSGGAEADTSAVTGESAPLSLFVGVECPSGALIENGSVSVRAVREYKLSVVARLYEAVERASKSRSSAEKKITRFAAVFTPVAFAVAVLVFAVGVLATGDIYSYLKAGIMVLVVSCPCSLVLSVPLTYFAGMGKAAANGIIFRGGEIMDRAARIDTVAFDKTGTLTEASPEFDGVQMYSDMPKEDFLEIAAAVLSHSPHVLAGAFCKGRTLAKEHTVEDIEILVGKGIVCTLDKKQAVFGNARLLEEMGFWAPSVGGTCIFGAYDGNILGALMFSAHTKEGARQALSELLSLGVKRMSLISGDNELAVRTTCDELGISEYRFGMSPDAKLDAFEELRSRGGGEQVAAYCGDGLNDSAVIASADVGIAMGSCGSALTVESADVVLMDDNLLKLPLAIKISRRTEKIANANIALSLGIKLGVVLLGVLLAVLGKNIPIELAIVADVGAAVVTVLNAARAGK